MAYKEEIDEDCENCKHFRPGRPARMYLRNGDPGYPAEDAECNFDWECPYEDEEDEEEEFISAREDEEAFGKIKAQEVLRFSNNPA